MGPAGAEAATSATQAYSARKDSLAEPFRELGFGE
jgi:hypothetical protein